MVLSINLGQVNTVVQFHYFLSKDLYSKILNEAII